MKTNTAAKFSDGSFLPVIDKCEGCGRIVEVDGSKYCDAYMNPGAKWRLGFCNLATHAKPEVVVVKARINPLKASKRSSRRK
jgi:hypothetical protein